MSRKNSSKSDRAGKLTAEEAVSPQMIRDMIRAFQKQEFALLDLPGQTFQSIRDN